MKIYFQVYAKKMDPNIESEIQKTGKYSRKGPSFNPKIRILRVLCTFPLKKGEFHFVKKIFIWSIFFLQVFFFHIRVFGVKSNLTNLNYFPIFFLNWKEMRKRLLGSAGIWIRKLLNFSRALFSGGGKLYFFPSPTWFSLVNFPYQGFLIWKKFWSVFKKGENEANAVGRKRDACFQVRNLTRNFSSLFFKTFQVYFFFPLNDS